MKILAFDTETTGLPKWVRRGGKNVRVWPLMVQLAWILYDVEKQKVIAIDNHIIRLPKGEVIPEKSIKFHGITNKMMSDKGVPIHDVFGKFHIHLDKADYVVAHNIDFDINVLKEEFKRNGFINLFNIVSQSTYYCTMKNGTKLCNILRPSPTSGDFVQKWPTLNELHQHLFHTSFANLHNAYNDVLVCFRCFYKMVYDEDIVTMNKKFHKMFHKTLENSVQISNVSATNSER